MHTNNFSLLVQLSAKYKDDPNYTKNKDSIVYLYSIGLFTQELESELWNGYPYVYANIRVLIEEIMNFFVEKELRLSIIEGYGEGFMTSDDVFQWIKDIKESHDVPKVGSQLKVEKSALNLKRKIDLVIICLNDRARERGIDLSNWELQKWRDQLNQTNHNILLPTKDAIKGFENRFQLFHWFHDTIYKDIVRMYFHKMVPNYRWPSKEELSEIASKYNKRIESYK